MTGNTKVWRAPLAGLASLAMLATMGVAAGTANAATVNAAVDGAAATVTVQVNGKDVNLQKGATYADALAKADDEGYENLNGSLLAEATNVATFGGFSLNGEGRVNLASTAVDGAKLTSIKAPSDSVRFVFKTADGDNLGAVKVERNAGSESVTYPKALALNDVASDHKILGAMTYVDKQGATQPFEYGQTLDLTADVTEIDVTVATSDAWVFTYGTADATSDDSSAYDVVYPGEYADGFVEGSLSVEIAAPKDGETTVDPSAVEDAMGINLKSDQAYAFEKWLQEDGQEFTAETKVKSDWAIHPVIKKALTVKFVVNGETWKTASVLKGHKAEYVEYVPTDGSSFKGWYTDKAATTKYDFNTKVTADTTLYAGFVDGGNYTVTYKFNDGKTEDKTEDYLANQVVAEPAAPSRDGYIFAGWILDNGDGVLTSADGTVAYAFGAAANKDITLIARWVKANAATLEAAFKYVDGSNAANNEKDYKGVFTTASFNEYVKTYQAVQKEYAKAQNDAEATGKPISDATFSDLLKELVAGWQKLGFVHEGDAASETVVYRLYNGNDHFYTQSSKELENLTSKGLGYTNEGRLFQTSPKEHGRVYAGLTSFAKVASGDTLTTLNSVADPILTEVTRLYNRVNGDHVWSVNPDEVASLSASADWNVEGAAFYVPSYTGSQKVVRLYNAKLSRHVLSTSASEQANLARNGWTVEGVAFKAY